MERFLTTLLALSLAGSALGLLLTLLRRTLGPRLSSRVLLLAWAVVLLRFVLPLPGLLRLPTARPAATAVPTAARSIWMDAPAAPEATAAEQTGPERTEPVPTSEQTVEAVPAAAPEEAPLPRQATPLSLWTLGFWLWAVGSLGAAGLTLGRYFRLRRRLWRSLRPARPGEVQALDALNPRPWPVLCRSALTNTPLLLGLLRPVIVLPERDYAPETLDGILRHELCHFRRGDLALKWGAAAVGWVHWFNPLFPLFRRELDRVCELSCDERLLRRMDREEKQRYGELLLELAAESPPPRTLGALGFATEKRTLEERLVQIMTYKRYGRAALALALAVLLLLGGCAVAMGPATVPQTEQTTDRAEGPEPSSIVEGPVPTAEQPLDRGGNGPEIFVDNVDGFLFALGSDRVIVLRAGEYDLTTASDYGGPATAAYSWAQVNDGYELVLDRLERLTIQGEPGAEFVSIVTRPRYASVLRLEGCRSVVLDDFTAGHTPEQGTCRGGVLCFNDCDDVTIGGCDLYGCGSIGIEAVNCRRVLASDTTVRECSYGALRVQNSYLFRFERGFIRDCGLKTADGCYDLLQVIATTGFSLVNTELTGNRAQLFLADSWNSQVTLLGCLAQDNEFHEGLRIVGEAPVIVGCGLSGNVAELRLWYVDPRQTAVDAEGNALTPEDLERMEWNRYEVDPEGITVTTLEGPEGTIGADGIAEYHVSTVDEFLACIGSNARIYLEGERFDLSTATYYGGYGGEHYYWQATYDGPGLVICGVEHLSIIGQGKETTRLEARPRYANVLSFYDCRDCAVEALTAGHTVISGLSCMGDVLSFRDCQDCKVSDCGLFGCGVNGVSADHSQGLEVHRTELYECSDYGAVLRDSEARFLDCGIHDCGHDTVLLLDGSEAVWNGQSADRVPERMERK